MNAAASCCLVTRATATGVRTSGTRSPPLPSWTGCCTIPRRSTSALGAIVSKIAHERGCRPNARISQLPATGKPLAEECPCLCLGCTFCTARQNLREVYEALRAERESIGGFWSRGGATMPPSHLPNDGDRCGQIGRILANRCKLFLNTVRNSIK